MRAIRTLVVVSALAMFVPGVAPGANAVDLVVGCAGTVNDGGCAFVCLADSSIAVVLNGRGDVSASCGGLSAFCGTTSGTCRGNAAGPASTLSVGTCEGTGSSGTYYCGAPGGARTVMPPTVGPVEPVVACGGTLNSGSTSCAFACAQLTHPNVAFVGSGSLDAQCGQATAACYTGPSEGFCTGNGSGFGSSLVLGACNVSGHGAYACRMDVLA